MFKQFKTEVLSPFGMVVTSESPCSISSINPDDLNKMMRKHRILVFRGFEPMEGEAFPQWCSNHGKLLEWEFGTVNTLKVDPAKKNYLYTESEVPMHWDGAFLHTPPHYIAFHCDDANDGEGGATTFCDTTAILNKIPREEIDSWEDIYATYMTEKVIHYGGDFMSAILGEHPVTGERVLRYAEPVYDLNPVKVFLHGLPVEKHAAFIEKMRERMYDPEVFYAHQWKTGDIVVADNHALLHGREALRSSGRTLRRVNIMTADYDEAGNWIPPVDEDEDNSTHNMHDLAEKTVKKGQGLLDFKLHSDVATFPQDFSKYINSHGEIYHWPAGGFHMITRYEDAKNVLTNKKFTANRATFFVQKMPDVDLNNIGDFFGIVARMMVMSDGKVHGMRRRSALQGISRGFVESFLPAIKQTVNKLLDPLEKNGEMEFVTEIARVLPSSVLADMFGIPEKDREFFRKCSNIMTGFFGGSVDYTNEVAIECNNAAIAIRDYFFDVIKERRANPQNDFLTHMLKAQEQYSLTDDELVSQATMMLVAGQVTTTDQICNNIFLMLNEPGAYAKLKANPELISSANDEFTRIDPAVNFIFRVATERMVINGQRIDAGDTVFISGHTINRDPEMFQSPDEIQLDRKRNRHMGFGHGPHLCIGASLGRMQMDSLIEAMVSRFPDLHFTPGKTPERDHYSLSFSGFKTIDISK